jgi:hypothetical protein
MGNEAATTCVPLGITVPSENTNCRIALRIIGTSRNQLSVIKNEQQLTECGAIESLRFLEEAVHFDEFRHRSLRPSILINNK